MPYKDHEPIDLAAANFVVGQLEGFEKDNITNAFAGFVDEVLGKINDGKEATVYLCRADADAIASGTVDQPYLAAKMYRARKFRNFENDRSYRNFDKMRDKRLARAMRGKTRKGQRAFHGQWIESEWQSLTRLWELGVRVPRPYLHYADGILMGYIGTDAGPAPRLINCRLDDSTAGILLAAILDDLKLMIEGNLVHGDFSAYNILFDGERHTIIDVPQAVDTRVSPDAYNLFQRDLINLEKYFSRYHLTVPVDELMHRYF